MEDRDRDVPGFQSRARDASPSRRPDSPQQAGSGEQKRFAVVYHLLSVTHNRRLRLRTWCEPGEPPMVDSVIEIWKSADWFEREAFDLFGILFRGHPDLRRLLTDYGFIGHPFRKDFPLIGQRRGALRPGQGPRRLRARQHRAAHARAARHPRRQPLRGRARRTPEGNG